MRKALVEMEVDRLEDIIARSWRSTAPGRWRTSRLLRPQARAGRRQRGRVVPPPVPGAGAARDLRHHRLPGAGDGGGEGAGRYSLGDADLLRRAMGKKIKAEMDAQRGRFVRGCVERGLDYAHADEIFDLLAKFRRLRLQQVARGGLRADLVPDRLPQGEFPTEFLAASMTMEMDSTDKLYEFRQEAKDAGITVEPPSLNRSGPTFEVHDGVIRYGLAALKGRRALGCPRGGRDARGPAVQGSRRPGGRINPGLLNKRVMEKLVAAGALDEIEPDRSRAMAAIGGMVEYAKRREKNGERHGRPVQPRSGAGDPADPRVRAVDDEREASRPSTTRSARS